MSDGRTPQRAAPALPATRRSRREREGWRTQLRISRFRGLGYCVIEVHPFDPARPDAPPFTEYRVYRQERGFPVGPALARFGSLERAQREAEALGRGSAERASSA